MTSFNPPDVRARTFCLTHRSGSTLPRSVTSPVIPTSARTGRPVSNDANAVVIATPALGPSLGTAPAGTWTWNRPLVESVGRDVELVGVRAHVRERDPRRLLHDVAELSGEREPVLPARPRGRLDEQNVAPGAGDGEAVATPGTAVRSAALKKNLLRPR